MGVFFVYILKSSVCLAVFYLFYRLLLSKETFHRFNRIAILGILLLSLILPLCEVTVEQQTEVQQAVLSWEQLLMLADVPEVLPETGEIGISVIHIVLIIYLAGIAFFVFRNLYSLIRMLGLLRSSRREVLEKKTLLIVHDREKISPFSWLKYVVISEKDLRENGREILIHELAHIHNRHSFDLFIADVCIFFQWFNPAAWLLKQELQNIHEYEADETVIKQGVDAKQYQLLIIKKAVGTRLYSMANSFNHSKLKKRITMMLKEKSSPWARLKYLYILPLAAVAVTAFARPEISRELEEISAVKVNDLTAIVEEKVNENLPAPTDSVIIRGYKTVGKIREIAVKDLQTGEVKVVTKELEPVAGNGLNVSITNADFGVRTNDEPGTFLEIATDNGNSPLFIVDGMEVPGTLVSALDVNKFESLVVLKDKSATQQYGEKGKNGVILIKLKKHSDVRITIREDDAQKIQE